MTPPRGSRRLGVILSGASSRERVAGRTLVERSRELLARAGCSETVVVEPGDEAMEGPVRSEGDALVVAGDVVFDRDVLPRLAERGEALLRCERGFVLATSAPRARELVRAHAHARDGAVAPPLPEAPSVGVVLPAATAAERNAAARALLAGTSKATDGPMRRLFERRVALLLAERLVERSVTPNVVTALSLGVGLAGAATLALPGYGAHVLGALLVVLAKLGDTCDGSLARAKLLESPRGDALDTAADILLSVATFAAVGASVVREDASALAWALLLVLGVVLCCVAHELLRRREPAGALAFLRETMDRAAMLEWGYPLLAFALAGSLDLFVVGAALAALSFSFVYFAVGAHASVG